MRVNFHSCSNIPPAASEGETNDVKKSARMNWATTQNQARAVVILLSQGAAMCVVVLVIELMIQSLGGILVTLYSWIGHLNCNTAVHVAQLKH